jgi:hypothetical protein
MSVYYYQSNQLAEISGLYRKQEGNCISDCSACYLLRAGFFLGLFFDPKDGGEMFLGNVS